MMLLLWDNRIFSIGSPKDQSHVNTIRSEGHLYVQGLTILKINSWMDGNEFYPNLSTVCKPNTQARKKLTYMRKACRLMNRSRQTVLQNAWELCRSQCHWSGQEDISSLMYMPKQRYTGPQRVMRALTQMPQQD